MNEAERGSSPRVWGILEAGIMRVWTMRFIPTRVGNTYLRRLTRPGNSVHPHACGEYWKDVLEDVVECGSSPRVWGIPSPHKLGGALHRFIPTRVGNT